MIRSRIKSFAHAIAGIATLIKSQTNARIHLAASLIVIAVGFILNISATEWSLLILAMAIVWVAEALNTAIEFLADVVTLDRQPMIAKAKDVAAGAVLLSAVGATTVGTVVFAPHLVQFFRC